jgi:hypothetical protein
MAIMRTLNNALDWSSLMFEGLYFAVLAFGGSTVDNMVVYRSHRCLGAPVLFTYTVFKKREIRYMMCFIAGIGMYSLGLMTGLSACLSFMTIHYFDMGLAVLPRMLFIGYVVVFVAASSMCSPADLLGVGPDTVLNKIVLQRHTVRCGQCKKRIRMDAMVVYDNDQWYHFWCN